MRQQRVLWWFPLVSHKPIYLNPSPANEYFANWASVPANFYIEGVYIVAGCTRPSYRSLSYVRKIVFQLDDPYGAVIGQKEVILTNQGTDPSGTTIWNGFMDIEKSISPPGSVTLLTMNTPSDLLPNCIKTSSKEGIILGTTLRGWLENDN